MNMTVTPGLDNKLLTAVYRKATHTDQYLHWDNYHDLSANSARTVCANPQLLQKADEQEEGGPSKIQVSQLDTKQA